MSDFTGCLRHIYITQTGNGPMFQFAEAGLHFLHKPAPGAAAGDAVSDGARHPQVRLSVPADAVCLLVW